MEGYYISAGRSPAAPAPDISKLTQALIDSVSEYKEVLRPLEEATHHLNLQVQNLKEDSYATELIAVHADPARTGALIQRQRSLRLSYWSAVVAADRVIPAENGKARTKLLEAISSAAQAYCQSRVSGECISLARECLEAVTSEQNITARISSQCEHYKWITEKHGSRIASEGGQFISEAFRELVTANTNVHEVRCYTGLNSSFPMSLIPLSERNKSSFQNGDKVLSLNAKLIELVQRIDAVLYCRDLQTTEADFKRYKEILGDQRRFAQDLEFALSPQRQDRDRRFRHLMEVRQEVCGIYLASRVRLVEQSDLARSLIDEMQKVNQELIDHCKVEERQHGLDIQLVQNNLIAADAYARASRTRLQDLSTLWSDCCSITYRAEESLRKWLSELGSAKPVESARQTC